MTISSTVAPRVTVTGRDLEEGLRRLGLSRGDAVEVHSSLSSLGWVEGGAAAMLEALMAVVGREGAIVMSAYPVSPALPLTDEEIARGIAWKVRMLDKDSDERTGMGVIADTFRKRPDVVLGHGLHRVAAWGRDTRLFSQSYQHLLDVGGWALLIGVDIHRCSSMHMAEGRVELPEQLARTFRVPDELRRDYPEDAWDIGVGDYSDDPWNKVWHEADRRGLIRRGRIGQAECALFRARDVVGIYEEFLRSDPFGLFGVEREDSRA